MLSKLNHNRMKNISTNSVPRFRRWSRKGWSVFVSFHREVSIGVLSVSMSLLLLANGEASAQTADSLTVARSLRIAGVDVAGSPAAPMRNAALSQSPLFDRRSEVGASVTTPEDVLRLVPSVDIRERGGRGTQADISIRGGSFDQTSVLLNGIDFTDARTGHQSHSLPLDLEAVSSIELVEGVPGVGAYAGAVHFRTAPLFPDYLLFDAAGGSYGYGYAHLSGATTGRGLTLFGAASYRRTDGYRHNTDSETCNAYLRLTASSRRWGMLDFQTGFQMRAFGSNGFYAAYNPDQWEHTQTALASLRYLKSWGRLSFGASASYRKNFDRYDWIRGEAMNRHNTDNVGARLWWNYTSAWGTTSLGGDYAFNHIYSTNLGDRLSWPHGDYLCATARHTGNVWVRHALTLGRVDLSASAGAAFSPYGTRSSWSVAGAWRPVRGLRVETGVWRSMRLPTFTDLYYTSPAQINNLDLRPEYATNLRLAVSYSTPSWRVSAGGFYRAGRDVIDWVWREDMGRKWHSEQSSCLDTYGVELGGGYHTQEGFLRDVSLSYAYTMSDRKNDLKTLGAMDFLKHKVALKLRLALHRRLSLAISGVFSDRNGSYSWYPTMGDSFHSVEREYRPFFLLNARVEWQLGRVRIYGDCANILDRPACDLGGLPLPGAWFTGGVSLRIVGPSGSSGQGR